jgi:hypothetical protein
MWRLFLDDDSAAGSAPIDHHVGVNLDLVAVGVQLVHRVGDIVILQGRKLNTRRLGTPITLGKLDFITQFERKVIEARLLTLLGISAVDIDQAVIMVSITVADEARLVVRLDIGVLESDHIAVVVVRTFVVAHPEIGMAEPPRAEISLVAFGGRRIHSSSPQQADSNHRSILL